MGIYVMSARALKELLLNKFPDANDFGNEVIPGAKDAGMKVQAFAFDGEAYTHTHTHTARAGAQTDAGVMFPACGGQAGKLTELCVCLCVCVCVCVCVSQQGTGRTLVPLMLSTTPTWPWSTLRQRSSGET